MKSLAPLDPRHAEILRFGVNGVAATAVHYAVLHAALEWLRLPSAGLANLLAAACGITASFLGNRYFVFRGHAAPLAQQASRFLLLYGAIAVLHGAVLALWTDWAGLNWRIGFLLATGLQMVLSYWGNKRLVFHPGNTPASP